MGRNLCTSQFKCRNFAFYCTKTEHELFFVTEWTDKRWVYLAYRIFIWAYQLGWWIARYVENSRYNPAALHSSYQTLTRWTHFVMTLYFTLALILCSIGFFCPVRKNGAIKALRSVTWALHSVSQSASIVVVVTYWAVLTSTASNLYSALNIHGHAIILVLFVIEIFIVAFPMRLLHAIYVIIFATSYAIALLIFHGAGINSAVYPILDWRNSPGRAAGIAVGLVSVGSTVAHSLMFGFYCLRVTISKRHESSVRPTSTSSAEKSVDNPAFEDDKVDVTDLTA